MTTTNPSESATCGSTAGNPSRGGTSRRPDATAARRWRCAPDSGTRGPPVNRRTST